MTPAQERAAAPGGYGGAAARLTRLLSSDPP